MRLVEDAVTPRWYLTGEDYEAYGFRKGKLGIVSVLDHSKKTPRTVKVTVDIAKLGLEAGKPLYIWQYQMNPLPDPNMPAPKGNATAAPYDPEWTRERCIEKFGNIKAVTPSILSMGQVCPKTLELDVPTEWMHTATVVLSHLPVVLERAGEYPLQMGIIENPDVWIGGEVEGQKVKLIVVCDVPSALLLLPGRSIADSTVNGNFELKDMLWADQPALGITVTNGRHELLIDKK